MPPEASSFSKIGAACSVASATDDISPASSLLRILGPVETLFGLGLLTASISWFAEALRLAPLSKRPWTAQGVSRPRSQT